MYHIEYVSYIFPNNYFICVVTCLVRRLSGSRKLIKNNNSYVLSICHIQIVVKKQNKSKVF